MGNRFHLPEGIKQNHWLGWLAAAMLLAWLSASAFVGKLHPRLSRSTTFHVPYSPGTTCTVRPVLITTSLFYRSDGIRRQLLNLAIGLVCRVTGFDVIAEFSGDRSMCAEWGGLMAGNGSYYECESRGGTRGRS